MTRTLWAPLLAIAFCSCPGSAYNAASKTDTVEAWREFLVSHPQDPNVENAKSRLEDLELARAREAHSVVGYKRFLEEFPASDKAAAARALLETLRYNAVVEKPSAPAWRRFLRDHIEGVHHDEAEKALGALELAEMSSVSDPAQLSRIAAENPDDARGLEASAKLDELDWLSAVSAAKVYAYLRAHPEGSHRNEAKTRLLSLQVDSLLTSGLVEQAAQVVRKSPLSSKVPDLDARLTRARRVKLAFESKDERVKRAAPEYYLRSIDDLVKALSTSPDPLDRWDAAQELGAHATARAIDPLLEALRTARSPLVRFNALTSLESVLTALPSPVAEYEVATRVEALRDQASDAQLYLTMAVLLDVSGQVQRSAAEYQRIFDVKAPDPLVLHRWATLRQRRHQSFSAAVAARQLAVWAIVQTHNATSLEPGTALSASREMCAVYESAVFAKSIIEEALGEKTEFPEDVEVFMLRAKEAERASFAKLRDAELAMLTERPDARTCGDANVRTRLDDAVKQRLAAIALLKRRPPPDAALIFEALAARETSSEVREVLKPSARE